ncbi:hypothetical protein LJB42_003461 [Komagataella kurtzmanii]|nr:hypothetical protein LJB42_003461 [Komagataella kurtzmanii]
MSKVTVSGSEILEGSTKTVRRSGNVASFKQQKTAIDTFGNVFKVPDYSIKDILDAIPKHCYERSLVKSMSYVVRDIVAISAIAYVGLTYIPLLPNEFLRFAAWSAYVFSISCFGFGIWILGHECGHSAFSNYGWVNDTVGWVLHSLVMVPYFSWKFSHAKHHKATGHMTRDMVFVPYTAEEFKEKHQVTSLHDIAEETPIYSVFALLFQQLGGLSLYLATNATGQPYPGVSKFFKSHYWPSSPVFDKKDYWYIVLSDLGILATLTSVYTAYKVFGFWPTFITWFCPWILVNHWLVFVTFLQHTDSSMPHYDAQEWTFAKGAAATIDREFGILGIIFHDIIETHVLHHYVSRIPFYHAREATECIKKVMGEHYRHTDENMWVSLWKTWRSCQFVENHDGVYMFRNCNNVGVKPKDT